MTATGDGISKVAMGAVTVFSLILGFAIAMLLFVVAPTLIVGNTEKFVHWGAFRTLVEGVIKIAIFVGYLAIVAMHERYTACIPVPRRRAQNNLLL